MPGAAVWRDGICVTFQFPRGEGRHACLQLLQARGFEGCVDIEVNLEANYPSVLHRPDMCPAALDEGSALKPARTHDEGDDHRITSVHKAFGVEFDVGPRAQPFAHRGRVLIGSVVDASRREVSCPDSRDVRVKQFAPRSEVALGPLS
ncbi:MAG TPA: hypothetical protein VKG38_04680 [Solirubrobacteraceae bacterium]|nr:hypothetical protein [Solirubrobacteraceae bacterium]